VTTRSPDRHLPCACRTGHGPLTGPGFAGVLAAAPAGDRSGLGGPPCQARGQPPRAHGV